MYKLQRDDANVVMTTSKMQRGGGPRPMIHVKSYIIPFSWIFMKISKEDPMEISIF